MKSIILFSSILLFSCGNAQKEIEKETNVEKKQTETERLIEIERKGMHDATRPIGFSTVSVDEFEKQIESPCTILDVRTPEEVAQGVIPNAIIMNINDADFAEKIKTLDITKPVCVYCKAGGRSAKASEMLSANGYATYNLDGGMDAWKAAGKSVEK